MQVVLAIKEKPRNSSKTIAAIWEEIVERMAVHFDDITVLKKLHDFKDKADMVPEPDAHSDDAVVIHFLNEDNDPHDASLLDMSVLFPGTAIITDSLTWVDAQGNFYEGTDWPFWGC